MPISDIRGKIFGGARPPQRIVSLVPSITEALFTFGAGARVVGVTDYCIAPRESVTTKTKTCGERSRTIGGTKDPRIEQILALEPDLVIANVEENIKPAVDTLEARGVPVFVMYPRTVRGAIDELRGLAQLVGAENAAAIIDPMEHARAAIHGSRKKTRGLSARRPRVFVAIWRDPWMTANGETFIGDLIETCGGENVFRNRARRFPLAADLGRTRSPFVSKSVEGSNQRGERMRRTLPRTAAGQDTRYPRVSLEEIAQHQPEVILLPDEPYRFTARDAGELRRAIPTARVYLVDGTLVTWHGVRLARALETIAGLVNETSQVEN